ncbi:hypothetical protein ACQPWW_14750 [Micromonospora sp. CA-240977]|uniref:hypothetical protein n=1 Tax=Micromonospora sp. CA-240977 TaxID=3239957 RepID=UPI003D93B069
MHPVDLVDFIVSGFFGPLRPGAGYQDVIDGLGSPRHEEPARKSSPMYLLYGDVEVRLRDLRVTLVSVSLGLDDDPDSFDPGGIEFTNLLSAGERTVAAVGDLLRDAGVEWDVDAIMSDDESPVWVTQRRVHLGFPSGVLQRVGAEY